MGSSPAQLQDVRTVQELRAAVSAGAVPELLFFWGHRAPRSGRPGSACFSQWFAAAFQTCGVTYPTAEHYMMAAKARLFGDRESEAKILEAQTPSDAKRLGRRVRGFSDEAWER